MAPAEEASIAVIMSFSSTTPSPLMSLASDVETSIIPDVDPEEVVSTMSATFKFSSTAASTVPDTEPEATASTISEISRFASLETLSAPEEAPDAAALAIS